MIGGEGGSVIVLLWAVLVGGVGDRGSERVGLGTSSGGSKGGVGRSLLLFRLCVWDLLRVRSKSVATRKQQQVLRERFAEYQGLPSPPTDHERRQNPLKSS